MPNSILDEVSHRTFNTCQTIGPTELPVNQSIPVMPLITWIRRPLAGLAGLSLLLFGHSMEARSAACQSYEAAFNLEAGIRDGLTLKQAKASILEDGYTDGSACLLCSRQE